MGKTINQLSAVDSVQSGDQLPIYDQSNGDARKASISVLQTYMQAELDFDSPFNFVTQREVPGVLGFVPVLTGSLNIFLILDGDSTEDVGFDWFTNGSAVDKQEVLIVSRNTANFIGFTGGVPTTVGWPTSVPPVLMADAENPIKFRYDAGTATWWRVT